MKLCRFYETVCVSGVISLCCYNFCVYECSASCLTVHQNEFDSYFHVMCVTGLIVLFCMMLYFFVLCYFVCVFVCFILFCVFVCVFCLL